jgi:hypothetical protein
LDEDVAIVNVGVVLRNTDDPLPRLDSASTVVTEVLPPFISVDVVDCMVAVGRALVPGWQERARAQEVFKR